MEQYILFNEIGTLAGLDGVNETVMFPASAALGIEPCSATNTCIWFKAQDGTADSDKVEFTHLAADRIAVYKALVQLLNTRTKSGYTVGANVLTGTLPNKCTAVAVTLS